jgi:hypothetical protein
MSLNTRRRQRKAVAKSRWSTGGGGGRLSSSKGLNRVLYVVTLVHCKKRLATFPSPAGMSLTKLSLRGNNLIFPTQGEFGK